MYSFDIRHWAHGVVVSHSLSMREALGSNPSVSIAYDVLIQSMSTHPKAHLFSALKFERDQKCFTSNFGLKIELRSRVKITHAQIKRR